MTNSQESQENYEEKEPLFKAVNRLRRKPLWQALKCFVTTNVCKYYEVASVQALLKRDGDLELWDVRQKLETTLALEKNIVGFFSCGTVLTQKVKNGHSNETPGLAFWVIFDWPEYGISALETYLSKLILKLDWIYFIATLSEGEVSNIFIKKTRK